ncbi:MAG: SOS response-associated peptidase [Devosiaceae bacterium]|nr:SOS response-associated peptidase [Devosiaceae bacterium]
MCGRFTLLLGWNEIHQLLKGFVSNLNNGTNEKILAYPDRFNIAPTQPILVLARAGEKVEPFLMRWGLVPQWVDNPADFPLLINARSETLAEKTSFKSSLKNQRCLIPATGYYEWSRLPDGTKIPQYITRNDGLPVLMAGLHSTWVGEDGEEVDTATIITIGANDDLKNVHHRTPVLLEGENIALWLDSANVHANAAQKLLNPITDGVMKFHEVSKQVNSPKNDFETLIIPAYETNQNENKSEQRQKPKKPSQLDLF